MINFNFELEPGKNLEKMSYEPKTPEVSVIVPFYNDGKYIEQTVNCILNQTYPYFELLIIDDGSTDKESLKKLEEIEKIDSRIKVFHKQNEGLAATRDYGASVATDTTKYYLFLDSDDLIEKTYLECSYWTLETNKDAAWAYADSVGFESVTYTWNKWFDSNKMKSQNELVSAALVRKSDFKEVKGYEIREKAVNEDWNFWLKLIAHGKYPVHMSFYGLWYRRKANGELKKATENKERSLEIINKTAQTIKQKVEAIQYPRQDYNYDNIFEKQEKIVVPQINKNGKTKILMIIPWMVTGGADKFNLELIKRLDKNEFDVTIITTEPSKYVLRQEFEKYCIVYDLTSFLDQKNWLSFINYIIEKEKIDLVFNTNSEYGYSILPYLKANNPEIPILDYVHMEEWYWKNGGYARNSATCSSVIDKTLVCNKSTERVLIEHFGKNKEEVKTIYIGVDEEKFNSTNYNKKELLKKYNLENNQKIIISYICRITEQKRPLLLLEIIKEISKKRNDILFLIVGNGNLLNKLKHGIQKYKLEEYVKFIGTIDKPEEIYAISDITINCSIKEGLALTSYESLAMGVPVISSNVGGQAELINNEVGKIVPCMQKETDVQETIYSQEEINLYINAIQEIIEKLEYYKENCRNRILEQFTLNQMAEKMAEIFKSTIQNPNDKKIENGKALSQNINITKEIICMNFMENSLKTKYQSEIYQKEVYGNIYTITQYNYKKELLKEKLWTYPAWRAFVLVTKKILGRN